MNIDIQRKKRMKSIRKKSPSISERVVQFILTRNLEELSVLTVVSVAAALELNRSHMSRSFKNEKGLTIEEYLFKHAEFEFDEVEIVNNRPMNVWLYAKCRRYIDPEASEDEQVTDAVVEESGAYDDDPTDV